jgi:hypothetical protein
MWKKVLQGHILSTTGDAVTVSNLSHLVFWTVKLVDKQEGSFDQFLKPSKIPFFLSQGNSSVECELSVSENDWIILLDGDDGDDDDDVRLWDLDNKDTNIAAFFSLCKKQTQNPSSSTLCKEPHEQSMISNTILEYVHNYTQFCQLAIIHITCMWIMVSFLPNFEESNQFGKESPGRFSIYWWHILKKIVQIVEHWPKYWPKVKVMLKSGKKFLVFFLELLMTFNFFKSTNWSD